MTFSTESYRIDGKVAVITGAGGRGNSIGRAYACGLAAAGASVIVADLNLEGAELVAREIVEAGGKAHAVQVDISDAASVARMAAASKAVFGGVDILINNAALMVEVPHGSTLGVTSEIWDKVMRVNLTGAFLCCQALVPLMRERGGGKIVNQVSAGAFPPATLYGISKLALWGLTTTLARELGKDKINVNAIAPGATMSDAGKALTPTDSPFVKAIEASVPLRFRGQPDELVGAMLLLCSPAGDWITGQVLNVDGGWVIRV
ncbi:MAG: short-chain dehydrogenase [Hydrocarboniphaga sp.]|uniref:SDR family oxidoreductase n=1 Tax=Hydrocarboniphaga sp. TaxID=2033016 RepID=UPI002638E504|nr:SDR family oxidoreductase [Hydrocarboniphaga sp.]MDB5969896.1 short-chain dehydrogenase [Hydrocarboniphaga sp.]